MIEHLAVTEKMLLISGCPVGGECNFAGIINRGSPTMARAEAEEAPNMAGSVASAVSGAGLCARTD
jgi:hypothetical protein